MPETTDRPITPHLGTALPTRRPVRRSVIDVIPRRSPGAVRQPVAPDVSAELRATRPGAPSYATSWRNRYRRGVLVTDIAVVALACALAGYLSAVSLRDPSRSPAWSAAWAALAMVLWICMLQMSRTRSVRGMAVGTAEYKRVVDATAATAGCFAVIALLAGGTGGQYHLLIGFPAGLAGLLAGRWFWRLWIHRLRVRGCALSEAVVAGPPADVRYVIHQIERRPGAAYRVAGVVLDGSVTAADEAEVSTASHHAPSFVGTHQILSAVNRLRADAVIVAGPLPGGLQTIRDLGWSLEASRTEILLVSALADVAGPRISVHPVEGLPLMHVEQPALEGGSRLLKRTLDIVVSALALLAMLPLFVVLAVLIRRDSAGGVFSWQTRTGRRGVPFRLYGFRTTWAATDQEKAGTLLRHHHLDELPRFWNVLKGDLSLVGPRPPLPDEAAGLGGHAGHRLAIRPGLTGLWQVNGRPGLGWEESVRLDLYYVEHWSVIGDLQILWRTAKAMNQPEGAY